MFLLDDIKQSRLYQDLREEAREEVGEEAQKEGRKKEAKELLLKQLPKRFGKLSDICIQHINNLRLDQLEELAEALLDFANISDLDIWLANLT
jgi:predicted transposase YdaD